MKIQPVTIDTNSADYKRGTIDAKRFAEFHVYEKRAILRNAQPTMVRAVSRDYVEGLRANGVTIR